MHRKRVPGVTIQPHRREAQPQRPGKQGPATPGQATSSRARAFGSLRSAEQAGAGIKISASFHMLPLRQAQHDTARETIRKISFHNHKTEDIPQGPAKASRGCRPRDRALAFRRNSAQVQEVLGTHNVLPVPGQRPRTTYPSLSYTVTGGHPHERGQAESPDQRTARRAVAITG